MQRTKMDKLTRSVINKYPIFVITFKPGTDMRKVFQLCELCHCLIRWKKFQNSRPIRQCFNCQNFGHSSNFCGRSPKCVKCDQQHVSKDCTKPVGSPPKCVNCGGEHPANYTGCPQYLRQLHLTPQINNQQQHKPHNIKTNSPQFRYQQAQFPALKTPQPSKSQQKS
jgi:PAX-interacting protein 1